MNYPLISEYIEAIKAAEDNFEKLTNLRAVLGDDGQPVMTSGNFAVVFKMKDEETGKCYALKCFTKEQQGRAEAYKQIAEELKDVDSPYLVSIRYLEKELFVDTDQTDETEFPVLLMDWVEGKTLDKYLRENLDDKYALEMLAYRFCQLAQWLIPQPFAHGDLKPDNILVREDGTLVLVDYDGMYVPAMRGQNTRELGSPNFRHPSCTEESFDERIDDFSIALIALSLKAFSLNTELISEYCSNDFMLFRVEDFSHINSCQVMSSILNIVHDDELTSLLGTFMIAYAKNSLNLVSPNIFNLKKPKEGQAYADYIYNQARNLCEEATDKSKINYKKAFEMFYEASLLGNADAQCCLGCCYKNGYGTPKDYVKSKEWYDKSAKNGNSRALRHIGFLYHDGIGVEQDIKKAIEWYDKAINAGDISAMVTKGAIFYYGISGIPIDYEVAVKLYTKAAEKGDDDGMWRLARCYQKGKGVEKDIDEAIKWYQLSSNKGNTKAQWRLGLCYINGEGVAKDYKVAVQWFQKAADGYDYNGQWRLGHCYEYGLGIEKNLCSAFNYYQKAAKAGSSEGQWRLARCYQKGKGVEKDIDEAIKWYQLSSNKGNTEAQWRLGLCYFNGEGVAKDYKVAVQWFQKAADGYDYDGQLRLGYCYEYGLGIEKNLCSAFNYYQKAAKAGSSEGQWSLGRCYEHGLGTQMNLPLAKSFYEQAAKKGNKKAQEALKRMENDDLPF